MNYQLNTVYYFSYLNVIGGIESHLYYLAKKYRDRDWTVVCRSGDPEQIARLCRFVQVIVIRPYDHIDCNAIFCTYDLSILNQVTAKEKYYVIHADYLGQVKNGTMSANAIKVVDGLKYLAVSKVAKNGYDPKANAEVVYMPIEPDPCEEPIQLISATRLTPEKGWGRIKILAKALDDAKVNYVWHIYTNKAEEKISENVYFMKPRLDITSKMPLYDALVQLSDNEAYCITIQEALLKGLKLIATPLPLIKEIKAEAQTVTLPFDMQDIGEQVEQIRNIKQMTTKPYKLPKEKWGKLLTGKSKVDREFVTVKATREYANRYLIDNQLGVVPKAGQVWQVTHERLKELMQYEARNKCKLIEIL